MTRPTPAEQRSPRRTRLSLTIDSIEIDIALAHADGGGEPIVFLHGFGSTKEDYLDAIHLPAFAKHPIVAFDAPGCGETQCSDLARLSIPLLTRTSLAVVDRLGLERFHLVGHSMGGLTAFHLAAAHPQRVISFVDIEGNLAPEDCFLSRHAVTHSSTASDKEFLDDLAGRTWQSTETSSALYDVGLHHTVRAGAARPILTSMVELSDHHPILDMFLSLPCPRMFMYGHENAHLSYLPTLAASGVELAEIHGSGHWPMYAKPTAMWLRIAEFIRTY